VFNQQLDKDRHCQVQHLAMIPGNEPGEGRLFGEEEILLSAAFQ
jgi:hypothetical protein